MIRWFARNDVAANFLMLAVLFLGLRAAFNHIPLEVQPSYDLNEIQIGMDYRGGTPQDVERTIVLPIEQALEGMTGIEELKSWASSGRGDLEIVPDRDADINRMLEEVQRRVDGVSFPTESEPPRIRIPNTESFWEVCTVVVYGDLAESDLLKVTQQVQDDLRNLPSISQVSLTGNRDREISIETDPEVLAGYGLTIRDLTDAVQRSSIDLPAGSVRTASGRMLLRTRSQAYTGDDFRNIIIRAADGAQLRLGDVATVTDGFTEGRSLLRFNGKRALRIEVMRTGNESAIEISNTVRKYIKDAPGKYPSGISFGIWDDDSISLRGRLSTLTNSLAMGAILVFIVLGLFLRPLIALAVMIGIPVSFAGGLMMMPLDLPFLPWGDMTLNMMSLFGFIIVVGIVVDDAIVTGENIFTKMREGMPSLEAAVEGTKEVATPVTFGVLTTIVAFLPLLFIDTRWGNFTRQIPPVVTTVLVFSLLQSKLVLPSHLKHLRTGRTNLGPFARMQKTIADSLETFVDRFYKPVLLVAAKHRYATLAIFLALGMAAIGYWSSGRMGFVMMPKIDRYQIFCMIRMPSDTPFEKTDAAVMKVQAAAEILAKEFRDPKTRESLVTGIITSTGVGWHGRPGDESFGMVSIEVLPPSERSEQGPGNDAFESRLRELVGPLDEADYFGVHSQQGRGNDDTEPIEVELRGPDSDQKRVIAHQIEKLLESFEGIHRASVDEGGRRDELEIQLKPRAHELGLTEVQLARQLRQSFFGDEAQRVRRDREDIRVMIRLPETLRDNLHTLQRLKVQTPAGEYIPFDHVATLATVKAPVRIERKNGARTLEINASATDKNVDLLAIAERAKPEIHALVDQADGLSWRFAGFIEDHYKTGDQTVWGWWFLAIGLYALLAIPFRGLLQPFVVMLAIPFGLIGALAGHLVMNVTPSYLSVFGMMALAGVVVNDALVMVDYANQKRRQGVPVREAILNSGVRRFRPILLTSLTTFAGLMPLILDRSIQAQFLIPMAISLAFGILFSTAITLFLIPCAYLANEDFKAGCVRLWRWHLRPFRAAPESPAPDLSQSSRPLGK